jgi:arylsulfatase A-like enzyme
LFNPDQWRGDALGHMGNAAAQTPVLDSCVQRDFVSFRNAFCQNPVCTPSRCSFMSGWYPHVRGHRTMHHMLQPDEPMLLRTLKENGYFVWWGGKNDVVPAENGFRDYCDVKFTPSPADFARWQHTPRGGLHGTLDEWRGAPGTDAYHSFYAGRLDTRGDSLYCDSDWAYVFGAIDQIHAHRNSDAPLCLYLPLTYPHPPYGVEEPYFSAIDRNALAPRIPAPEVWNDKPSLLRGLHQRQNLASWSEERWNELRATYLGMCKRVDYQFGLVLQALRDAGLYDEAAVFLFSDHGDFTGDYGLVEKTQNTFEDCLTRVPLLVKPPVGNRVQARISESLVELVDIPATVLDFAGIAPDATSFGRSLSSILSGETDTHRDAVFCEGGRLQSETHCIEPVAAPEDLYWPRLSLQARGSAEHGKATMCRTHQWKYVRRLYESDELYDLRADPGEERNCINDPARAAIRDQLKDRMLLWYQATCDVVPHRPNQR